MRERGLLERLDRAEHNEGRGTQGGRARSLGLALGMGLAAMVGAGCASDTGVVFSRPNESGGQGAGDAGAYGGTGPDAGGSGGVSGTGGVVSGGSGGASTGGRDAGTGGVVASGGGSSGSGGTTPTDGGSTGGNSGTGGTGGTSGSGGTGGTSGSGGNGGSAEGGPPDGSPGSGGVVGDSGTDAGACGANGTHCTLAGGGSALCKDHVCAACAATAAGNTACSTAYGNGAGFVCASGQCVAGDCNVAADCPGGQICGLDTPHRCGDCASNADCRNAPGYGVGYLCASGLCVPGDCTADADCATGTLCGVTAPNHCGPCATDAECAADPTYGAGTICNTTTGTCVSGACSGESTACDANAGDVCCKGACVSGSCCKDNDCATGGGQSACVDNTCTSCNQVGGNTVFVDPLGGSDAVGTGDNQSGCAFKTISRALSFAASSANAITAVTVLTTGPVGTADNGEVFPLVVPGGVTLAGDAAPVSVHVPSGTVGFVLDAAGSSLSWFAIDGQGAGLHGLWARRGADAVVGEVSVTNMTGDGIDVTDDGMLEIHDGTSSSGNGGSGAADGMRIADAAFVSVVAGGNDPIQFDGNAEHGIFVTGQGSIAMQGKPANATDGTITANGNGVTGVAIEQTPNSGSPSSTLRGVVASLNTGSGFRFAGGTGVTLRGSVALGNHASGVLVTTYENGNLRSNDTSKIDLGADPSADPGDNVLQLSAGNDPNVGAGICLSLDRIAGSSLSAAGNTFSGPVNCADTPGTLARNATCTRGVDISVRTVGATANTIVVSECQ